MGRGQNVKRKNRKSCSNWSSNRFNALLRSGKEVPRNEDSLHDQHKNKLKRFRDCATFKFMHESIRKRRITELGQKHFTNIKPFDSVRGVFTEGGPAFDGAGFDAKSHIQICIRNPNCIKGFFLKRDEIDFDNQESALFPLN